MNEPIVCTPADAVKCFLNSGLDVLVFKNIIVYKYEVEAYH
jgi:carbamoyltransferase